MIFGGDSRHLDISFRDENPPQTVTDILAACGDSNAWDLPVSRRICRLLEIIQNTTAEPSVEAVTHCRYCGEQTSVELLIPDLKKLEPEGRDSIEVDSFRFRHPTGRDQALWLGADFKSVEEATVPIAQTLCESPLPEDRQLVERASVILQENDPLVAFRVDFVCPSCGEKQRAALDLQRLCLNILRSIQEGAFRAIHRLAAAYGWTEAEILRLSPRRRERYLRLIDGASP
ncbi:MAG: hypothetical protein JSW34_03265 [Candidatus Zixiibacteriota bacterium]|nr:MAG: hypothetical protein JSW34_03265 [candidate division Zixibacteria bacterium]